MYDVIIIGAGIIGLSAARELSRYKLKVCVIEKEADVGMGTTKANSAIVHAGFDAKPGTLKAKLNVDGNRRFKKLSEELQFKYIKNGALVLCFYAGDYEKLVQLYEQGIHNGVENLRIIDRTELLKLEPALNDNVHSALLANDSGIVCPYGMAIALAENAYQNGIEFFFENKVTGIEKTTKGFVVTSEKAIMETKLIVNAAGLYSDEINNMVSSNKLKILPRRGEYCVFDKAAGNLVNRTIFQLPTKVGKGVLVTPTVDGNLLVGPNAVEASDPEAVETTIEGINEILEKAALSVRDLPTNLIINSFAGLRARTAKDDFILGEAEDEKDLINAAGIESPGLTSAPAIGVLLSEMIVNKLQPLLNLSFNAQRRGIKHFNSMTEQEIQDEINLNNSYGNIICRCEVVSEGEILDAIHRIPGARTLDGIKTRTRAGMGRCQGGFCSSRLLQLLSREHKISETQVTKMGIGSNILFGNNKEI